MKFTSEGKDKRKAVAWIIASGVLITRARSGAYYAVHEDGSSGKIERTAYDLDNATKTIYEGDSVTIDF